MMYIVLFKLETQNVSFLTFSRKSINVLKVVLIINLIIYMKTDRKVN